MKTDFERAATDRQRHAGTSITCDSDNGADNANSRLTIASKRSSLLYEYSVNNSTKYS